MANDQHFCLRWNNHQSTLISVFDTLLESGTLVDCTLAADGQQLNAHKVVLSACSPYLEALLSQHFDKHPIIILRDVKYPELKAMIDYMYRGEVNITQEQLGTFLKAAESLQIKGLTDNGAGASVGDFRDSIPKLRKQIPVPAAITPQSRPHHSGNESRKSATHLPSHVMDIPPSSPLKAREGSISPVVRKRRKPNHPVHHDDAKLVHTPTALHSERMNNSANDLPGTNANTPVTGDAAIPASNNSNSTAAAKSGNETPKNMSTSQVTKSDGPANVKMEQIEPLLQPKTEYSEDINDNDNENSQDIMEEEEEEEGQDLSKPGTSQPNNNNNQGYGGWMEGDSSSEDMGSTVGSQQNSQGYQWHGPVDGPVDEAMLAAHQQESQGSVRKFLNPMMANWESWSAAHPSVPTLLRGALSSYSPPAPSGTDQYKGVECPKCGRHYKLKSSLRNHQKWECGKEPQFQCPYCNYRAKQKMHVARHIERMHREKLDLLEINDRSIKDEKSFTAA